MENPDVLMFPIDWSECRLRPKSSERRRSSQEAIGPTESAIATQVQLLAF
jgi:hypothetical protein